jgi:hypothetical protein
MDDMDDGRPRSIGPWSNAYWTAVLLPRRGERIE